MEHCRICRAPVPADNRTMLVALGKPLGVVHARPCARVAQESAASLGRVALTAGELVLKSRVPRAFRLLQGVRALVRKVSSNERL